MEIEALVKDHISKRLFDQVTADRIEAGISSENHLHNFLFGQYLYHWKEFDRSLSIGDKTAWYLNAAYGQWPENAKGEDAYAHLNKLLLRFYFMYGKFHEAQTFIVNFFDTLGEDNIQEPWAWRYRFKIFSEIELSIVVENVGKYLKWLERAYALEKERDEKPVSLDVLTDFLNRSREIPEYDVLLENIHGSGLTLIEENREILESRSAVYEYVEPDYGEAIDDLRNKIEDLEDQISGLNGVLRERDDEIRRLNAFIQQVQRIPEAHPEVSDIIPAKPLPGASAEDVQIHVGSVGIMGESQISEGKILSIIKRVMISNNITPPEKRFIQVIASEYDKTKKTNLKRDIEASKWDWLIIGAHPHKLKDFPENMETFIRKAQQDGYCSTRFAQCMDSAGKLMPISNSNLKRAVRDLVMQERAIQ
jgi:hypothetical protein